MGATDAFSLDGGHTSRFMGASGMAAIFNGGLLFTITPAAELANS